MASQHFASCKPGKYTPLRSVLQIACGIVLSVGVSWVLLGMRGFRLAARRKEMGSLRTILVSAWLVTAIALGACAPRQATRLPTETPVSGQAQIANPAAAYCVKSGHTWQIRTAADGSQYGACVFADGTECEEWAFFRGECIAGVRPTETPMACGRVSIPDLGLTFEVPPGWQKQDQGWVWAPGPGSTVRLGIAWRDVELGQEPESILPANAVVLLRSEGPQFPWGVAVTYKLQVMQPAGQGQVRALETHVVVTRRHKRFDFYASASSDEDLDLLEGALQGLLASISWDE